MTFALIGCGDPNPLTVVDELRVLAVQVEPASPAVGEVPVVDALIVDPLGQGFQSWSWACVEQACDDGPVPQGDLLSVWVLACEQGACDGPGDDLADPSAWMGSLPIEGVTLARRSVPISPSAEERLNNNPALAPDGELPAQVAVGSTTELTFRVVDLEALDPAVYGFATIGGFRMVARPVLDGVATVEFVAPTEAGVAELYVVVEDGLGGSAWWSGSIEVR